MKPPFFILGSVRSGTTLLRRLLCSHPALESPNETHIFTHCHPFGTEGFRWVMLKDDTLEKHRAIDGVSKEEFEKIVQQSVSRHDLLNRYGALYLQKKMNPKGRWFDKTPQHIYGMLLISAVYPYSKFVHIVRNPLNVVSSLKIGKQIHVSDVIGAINYWMEAMCVIDQFQKGWPERLIEVRYEDLLKQPEKVLSEIVKFIGEDPDLIRITEKIHEESNKFMTQLTQKEVDLVRTNCRQFMQKFGYN